MPTVTTVPGGGSAAVGFAVPEARADAIDRGVARRTARRTTRRVDRRQDYLDSLPRGCVTTVVGGMRYWRCGSLYYREVLDNDRTVFVIVNP